MSLGRRLVRFNENDERALAVAQLNAELSVSEIAKLSGLKANVVRHSFLKLMDEGVIQQFWYINVYALGQTIYTSYFTLAALELGVRAKLIEHLIEHPSVVFFFETSGQYDFGLSIQASSAEEFASFMAVLGERFGECFQAKSTAVLMSLTDFPLVKKFSSTSVVKSFRIGNTGKTHQVDKLDQTIIEALIKHPTKSLKSISQMLGEPQNTLSYRVSRLKREGIIVGSRFFLDYLRFGYSLSGHQITLAGCSQLEIERMTKFFSDHPNVYYVYRCIGSWDFEIGTIIFEPRDASRFSNEVMERFGKSISKLTTFFICAFLKLNGTRYVKTELSRTAY